ncbi:MAG: TlpA family protein disulfide reductase [Bradymonadia bacterium]
MRTLKTMLLSSMIIAAAALGCDDVEDDAGGEAGAGGGGAGAAGGAAGGVDRATYPASGYGTSEGAILTNLGFVDDLGNAIDLGDIRMDASNKVLLISTSAGWCTACIEEQPKLQALSDELHDDGLVVFVALFEDAEFNPSNADLANQWRRQYSLGDDVYVVSDEPFVLQDYYDRSLTPMTMIVDLDTMEMVKIDTGFDESAVRAIIGALL